MIYVVNLNGTEYEVDVEEGQAKVNEVRVTKSGIIKQVKEKNQDSGIEKNAEGINYIKAPMPGTIVEMKVTQGMKVEKGQVLCILEAMKMENEVFSTVEGVVAEIAVNKGNSVETNDVLMVIE